MASPNEGQGPAAGRSQRRSRSRLCRANVRAGRPRSRGGINHPTNREHDLRQAQEWGKGPFARRKEPHGAVAVRSQRRRWPRLCRAMVRAGRPRSRVGILLPSDREHGLHHALKSGEGVRSTWRNSRADRLFCGAVRLFTAPVHLVSMRSSLGAGTTDRQASGSTSGSR